MNWIYLLVALLVPLGLAVIVVHVLDGRAHSHVLWARRRARCQRHLAAAVQREAKHADMPVVVAGIREYQALLRDEIEEADRHARGYAALPAVAAPLRPLLRWLCRRHHVRLRAGDQAADLILSGRH